MWLGDTKFFNLFALIAASTNPDRTRKDAFRNGRWVHLVKGARADVFKWFAEQEGSLER
jgi:hypothetical protein